MSSGSDEIVITVRLEGEGQAGGGAAPPTGGGGTGPPSPPAPGDEGDDGGQGGGGRVRDQWWWLYLIQGRTGREARRAAGVMQRAGVSRGAAGLAGGALAGSMLALAVAIRGVTEVYKQNTRALETIATFAASPQIEVLQDIAQLRIEIARLQRGQRFAPRIERQLAQQTQLQIATEGLRAEFADVIRQLTGPFASEVRETVEGLSNLLTGLLRIFSDSGQARMWGEVFLEVLELRLGPLAFIKDFLQQFSDAEGPDVDFEGLMWALSPDNPANQPFAKGSERNAMFSATANDRPPNEDI